ncbi:LSU ribosomal protein L29P [Deinococcus reticulitermitis]|uniref:Large ribosomal subunit protein uL29 n=1 Tax=Deinococcus reticulitermitis TaxID=856736 RepID=A0A1H7BH93_9DEIO|nr:50S ribosomal protein L29 [Deinococcus reticulitermitis]SEJ76949.1 LSU ribosomal protein L29P [Deinococcus reticulitermitis]
MKPSEMRNLNAEDFAKEIDSRKRELMELRFQAAAGQLAQPHRVRQLRREVAQLNTVKSEQARKGEQQ